MNLRRLQDEVSAWSQHNFGDKFGSGYRLLLGIVEEVGELSHAHLKQEQEIRGNENHYANKVDAVGDIVIYLADYCTQQGINLAMAVDHTWREVQTRDWRERPDTAAEAKEE